MQSRMYALGASLAGSLFANGLFSLRLQKVQHDLHLQKKQHEQQIQAIRNEPTSVTVSMQSSAFEKGSSRLALGQFDGRGKDVNVTFYVNETDKGNTHSAVGVTFGKK